jgi:acetylornithine deacetylase/succinyl-diaminopimelate desuccinylase-like protein
MEAALLYAVKNQDLFLNDLKAILRFESVSTDQSYKKNVFKCAQWLVNHIQNIGVKEVELISTNNHPIIYARHHVDDKLPHLLIYGHYDVQHPGSLHKWDNAPFTPVIRDGTVYGRGASDDKGQLLIILKAIESLLKTETQLSFNLKILLEGEEEIGSGSLHEFLLHETKKLKADISLICDTAMIENGIPAITYGLRGHSAIELSVTGSDIDTHSGVYGGAIDNPIHVLATLISKMKNGKQKIQIPGFYDDVLDVPVDERESFRKIPLDIQNWQDITGVKKFNPENNFTVFESTTIRPSLDVTGFSGGYTGEGSKSIIPSSATAKISFRFVPDQNPEYIIEKMKSFIDDNVPDTVSWDLKLLTTAEPSVLINLNNKYVQSASRILEDVFDRKTLFVREGGSIPVVSWLKKYLNLESILIGFGLNSDNIHAPNEHFGLDRFHKGIISIIRFLTEQQNGI